MHRCRAVPVSCMHVCSMGDGGTGFMTRGPEFYILVRDPQTCETQYFFLNTQTCEKEKLQDCFISKDRFTSLVTGETNLHAMGLLFLGSHPDL